jgi:hypothetical protein
MMRRDHQKLTITPGASAEEAAAVVAGLEQFQRGTAEAEPVSSPSGWKLSSLREGMSRTPDLLDSLGAS